MIFIDYIKKLTKEKIPIRTNNIFFQPKSEFKPVVRDEGTSWNPQIWFIDFFIFFLIRETIFRRLFYKFYLSLPLVASVL